MDSLTAYQFISIDLPAILAALFAALSCALLGNYLVLRKQALMGDAISHSVLPGIVIAFLIFNSRATEFIFIGAAVAGILTALLVEVVRKLGNVESGAAMGVVFSIFFALGVLLIERAAARSVDLDADCVLHGQLETVFWYPPNTLSKFFSFETLKLLPAEVVSSFSVFLVVAIFVLLFFKELKISSFDPGLSSALGFSATGLHYILMIFVAAAVVASFQVVGSILVIAMLICPPACARLLTDKLSIQILLSMLFALICSVLGYLLAAFSPFWFGSSSSVNAAGSITVLSGILLGGCIILAPRYGVISKKLRQVNIAIDITLEDLLGILFRISEQMPEVKLQYAEVKKLFGAKLAFLGLRRAKARGVVEVNKGVIMLTPDGLKMSKGLVRKHRLWESYLVSSLGLRDDHVHQRATQFEHFTSGELAKQLARKEHFPVKDPHGKIIPPED